MAVASRGRIDATFITPTQTHRMSCLVSSGRNPFATLVCAVPAGASYRVAQQANQRFPLRSETGAILVQETPAGTFSVDLIREP
jgi:hypothetical protein